MQVLVMLVVVVPKLLLLPTLSCVPQVGSEKRGTLRGEKRGERIMT
jgi:hypothetical protein